MTLPTSFNFTSLAGLTAIGAIIAATWRYIVSFGRYLVGLVIGTSIIKDEAGAAVTSFSFKNAWRSPFGTRIFGGYESYVHPKRWVECIGYEGLSQDPILIKYKKHLGLVSMASSSMKESAGPGHNTITIRYLRWFFDINQFIIDAIEFYNEEKRNTQGKDSSKNKRTCSRFKVIRYSGSNVSEDKIPSSPSNPGKLSTSSTEEIEKMIMTGVFKLLKWKRTDLQQQPEEGQSPFTGYPFPSEIHESIKELECWLANEKWFRSKSIPWRRGWLFFGCPGSGKSTLVRALGMTFDLPVFTFDLSGMSNDHFIRAWEEMMCNTPCIALIEDIDNIFNGREYVGSKNTAYPHITFDCLLNSISGVKQADGVFLIVTTNHIDKIDPAIGIPDETGKSSRPGRIDKAIHLGLMATEQRILLAKHILADFPELVDKTVADGDGETAAQFQNRCAKIALEKFWKDPKFLDKKYEYGEVMKFRSKTYATIQPQEQESPISDYPEKYVPKPKGRIY